MLPPKSLWVAPLDLKELLDAEIDASQRGIAFMLPGANRSQEAFCLKRTQPRFNCSSRKFSVSTFRCAVQSARRIRRYASVFASPTTFGILDTLPCRRVFAHIHAIIGRRAFHPIRRDRDYRRIA